LPPLFLFWNNPGMRSKFAGLFRLVMLSRTVEFRLVEAVVVVVILFMAWNAVKSYLFGVQHWS
jgi:hypothetical protein